MYEYFITTPRPRVERVKMDPESEPTPKGKRKHSKKTKKNWRKFTDIKEIEEYLEERRKDERTGYELQGGHLYHSVHLEGLVHGCIMPQCSPPLRLSRVVWE